jgi:hypothetical protein
MHTYYVSNVYSTFMHKIMKLQILFIFSAIAKLRISISFNFNFGGLSVTGDTVETWGLVLDKP